MLFIMEMFIIIVCERKKVWLVNVLIIYIYVCMLKCEVGCKCIYKSFKNWVCINLGVEKCWVYIIKVCCVNLEYIFEMRKKICFCCSVLNN